MTYKGIPITLTVDLSAEIPQARRERHNIFKVMIGKPYNQDYFTQQGFYSNLKER